MSSAKLLAFGLSLEGASLLLALGASGANQVWIPLIASHAGGSVLLATFLRTLLPASLRQPRIGVIGLLGTFCFALPGVGVAMLLAIGIYLRVVPPRPFAATGFDRLTLPDFDPNLQRNVQQRVTGLANQAIQNLLPAEKKIQVLLSLQEQSGAGSAQMLREALRDGDDEIRLLAYAIIDRKEKSLMQHILDGHARLKTLIGDDQRLGELKRLSDLYWELLHQGLAQGDLRQYTQERALAITEEALSLQPTSVALRIRRARLHLLGGNHALAFDDLEWSHASGAAASQTVPYMAEIAFRRRDFGRTRDLLAQLAPHALSPRLRRLVDLWGC